MAGWISSIVMKYKMLRQLFTARKMERNITIQ